MNSTHKAWMLGAAMIAAAPLYAGRCLAQDVASRAAVAQREYDEVMALTPNLADGAKSYLTCAVCHRPEGWGSPDGEYPQIAGQLRTVIIKQLADIRARNRDNPLMYPFSMPRVLGGPQQLANVAAYVAQLPMTSDNGKGPGTDLELGKRLYWANCVNCHGAQGEGKEKEHMPAIAGQHYLYLVRQFDAIRTGRRKNADPNMADQIQGFSPREEFAVLDYTSRLTPAREKLAEAGWQNPDFPNYVRPPMPGYRQPPPSMHPQGIPLQPSAPQSVPEGVR